MVASGYAYSLLHADLPVCIGYQAVGRSVSTRHCVLPARAESVSAARRFVPLRKHAQIVRRCRKCGRDIRGNAFFRHVSKCEVVLSASA